ncbi:MAG: hypothetical protein KGO96_12295 [Elusimicrobia bacterium]|nr:hypothetical protein [Elusimicrobiota bacterium]MDE2426677.1 hypothetical protein [Elusimicrobiota bacterium]
MTNVVAAASSILSALEPVVNVFDPEIGAVLAIVSKVVSGVSAAEPTAVSLYNSLTSGTPPTAAELEAYAASYEAAYQQLKTDLGNAS